MAYELYDQLAAPVFVVVRTEPGAWKLVFANSACRAFSGLPEPPADGVRMDEIFPPAVATQLQENYEAALSHGAAFSYREVLSLPSGERWSDTTLTPDPTRPGTMIGTAIDVTMQVESDARRILEDSEREEFIALAAHDMRAPLRQILQLTEMLAENFVDHGDGKKELIEWIAASGGHAMELTDKILTYVLADHGAAKVERTSLARLARDVLHTIDVVGEHSMIAPQELLEADSAVLLLMVRNLIENSIKHGRNAHMQMRLDVSEPVPGQLEIHFSDDGVGFAENFPTGPLDGNATRTGFGLRTLVRILRNRGGSLQPVPSRFGYGAGLCATLPGHLVASQKVRSA